MRTTNFSCMLQCCYRQLMTTSHTHHILGVGKCVISAAEGKQPASYRDFHWAGDDLVDDAGAALAAMTGPGDGVTRADRTPRNGRTNSHNLSKPPDASLADEVELQKFITMVMTSSTTN